MKEIIDNNDLDEEQLEQKKEFDNSENKFLFLKNLINSDTEHLNKDNYRTFMTEVLTDFCKNHLNKENNTHAYWFKKVIEQIYYERFEEDMNFDFDVSKYDPLN